MPFYVSPEQMMRDRAEFARKGIQRGRAVIACSSPEGIVLVAHNHSKGLKKLAEIYDRIAFAAVGRYHEFEALRVEGIRQADLKGYAYDRRDVSARSLVGNYSQQLGAAFASAGEKPFEVELVVAELGLEQSHDALFRVSYDGTLSDPVGVVVLGGQAEQVEASLDYRPERLAAEVVSRAAEALAVDGQVPAPEHLEVALLDRSLTGRTFRRIWGPELQSWLSA